MKKTSNNKYYTDEYWRLRALSLRSRHGELNPPKQPTTPRRTPRLTWIAKRFKELSEVR